MGTHGETTRHLAEDMPERLCLELTRSDGSMGLQDLGVKPAPIEKHLDFMQAYYSGGARQIFMA